mgnify:CR=1 FL=1
MPSKHVIEPSEYASLRRSACSVFSLFDRSRGSAPGFFREPPPPPVPTRSPTPIPQPCGAAPPRHRHRQGSRHAAASTAPRRPARGIPVPGRQRGHAALAIRLDPKWATAPTLIPSCRAACFCRMPPNTSSIAFCPVSMGMMGLLIRPCLWSNKRVRRHHQI